MSYSPTNAAIEIVKQIATSLSTNSAAGNATDILLGIINNDVPPPTNSGLNQTQWDALKLSFNLKNSQAAVDGWLRPSCEGQAISAQPPTTTYTGGLGWQSVTGSGATLVFTPYSPRPLTVIASLSGIGSGAGNMPYRVVLVGSGTTVVASGTCVVSASSVIALPPLMGVVTPDYPLVSQTLRFEVNPTGFNFVTSNTNGPISFAIF